MKLQCKRSAVLAAAAALLCAVLLAGPAAGPAGWAQPAPVAGEPPMDPGQLHEQVIRQLVGAWAEISWEVAKDPMFLESPQAEPLMMRAETLKMIHREMSEALRPWGPGPGPGPEGNGRFQFVEWLELGPRYWVLDTRTGELQVRQAPPVED